MSWIQVTSQSEVVPADMASDARYKISVEVNLSSGIERELFVYRVTDLEYSHVARYNDLVIFPNTLSAAQEQGVQFFRKSGLELTFPTEQRAVDAQQYVLRILKQTNAIWGSSRNESFGNIETVIYDSEDK